MIGLRSLPGVARFGAAGPRRLTPRLLATLAVVLALLAGTGLAGLLVVADLNATNERVIGLHRKITAYRQIQHDATSGLFDVASALLGAQDATLESALRQFSQFGYDIDRLAFVAREESTLLEAIRADHRVFEDVVTEVVGLIRAGRMQDARALSDARIGPLAERMERQANEMVNRAEAEMVDAIADAQRQYGISRLIVAALVLSGAAMALFLGHALSWSMVGPAIDRLLHAILPPPIVQELTATNRVQPRRYEDVVVLFADIVDFTAWCDAHPPEEVVANLQLLVEAFEALAERHGLEKTKTVGDALMATGNLLVPHAAPVAAGLALARDLAAAAARNPARWRIRVGIHVGPVVAGVVGRSKFAFDLWGDTVNVAARLAELDQAAIHLSGEARDRLPPDAAGAESLGFVAVKGKQAIAAWRFRFPDAAPAAADAAPPIPA